MKIYILLVLILTIHMTLDDSLKPKTTFVFWPNATLCDVFGNIIFIKNHIMRTWGCNCTLFALLYWTSAEKHHSLSFHEIRTFKHEGVHLSFWTNSPTILWKLNGIPWWCGMFYTSLLYEVHHTWS